MGAVQSDAFSKQVLSTREPEHLPYMESNSVITAIGTFPDGSVVIGEDAVMAYQQLAHLTFDAKGSPSQSPEFARTVPLFLRAMHEWWMIHHRSKVDGAPVYVGVPSGWTPEECGEYRRSLCQSGIKNIKLVKESRAAFIKSAKMDPDVIDITNVSNVDVLVCDWGGSTLDFTYIKDIHSALSFDVGAPLGASILDRLILDAALALHPRRADILDLIKRYPALRARLLLTCRRNKEAFFARERNYRPSGAGVGDNVTNAEYLDVCGEGILFVAPINGALMDRLLDQPLPELDGRSWRQALRLKLEAIRERLGGAPRRVVMTGGASRMAFVRDMVKEVFRLEADAIWRDPEPEFSVGRGVALAGELDVRVGLFRAELDRFLQVTMVGILEINRATLATSMAAELTGHFINVALRPALAAFQDGRVASLKSVAAKANELFTSWQDSPESLTVVRRVIRQWFQGVRLQLEVEPRRICVKYGLAESTLSLPSDMDIPLNLSADVDLDTLIYQVIVGAVFTLLTLAVVHGPVGLVLAACGAVGAAIFGDEIARLFMSPDRIQNICGEHRHQIQEALTAGLLDSRTLEPIIEYVAKKARASFTRSANNAEALLAMTDVRDLIVEDQAK
jgi:hypothetical protein